MKQLIDVYPTLVSVFMWKILPFFTVHDLSDYAHFLIFSGKLETYGTVIPMYLIEINFL